MLAIEIRNSLQYLFFRKCYFVTAVQSVFIAHLKSATLYMSTALCTVPMLKKGYKIHNAL